MEITEIDGKKFDEIINSPYHVFNSACFNELNKDKCDEVFYLLFNDGKYRLGFIGGCTDKILYSPFSGPFGGLTFISHDIRIQHIEEALRLLKVWATEKNFSSLNITTPPLIYESSFIAKQINCLWREDFIITRVDLNYSFSLEYFDDKYTERIWYNAQKNLRISNNAGLRFQLCKNDDEKKVAYDIIRKNRESRGYPLRMTWNQVSETIRIIQADFFLVYDLLQNSIASAIVFHVAKNIVQVIYWGDIHEFANLKTMNFLSYKIFEYYKKHNMQIVDIGPSTDNSTPIYGLAEFKESIGCMISPKFTFTLKLK
jgi:hypothetical protein